MCRYPSSDFNLFCVPPCILFCKQLRNDDFIFALKSVWTHPIVLKLENTTIAWPGNPPGHKGFIGFPIKINSVTSSLVAIVYKTKDVSSMISVVVPNDIS